MIDEKHIHRLGFSGETYFSDIFGFHPVPGSQLPNPLEFPDESKLVSSYLNEETFEATEGHSGLVTTRSQSRA